MNRENNVIRYGSVCSGIEAATSAWHGLGWQPSFFSEIEAFPRAVLAHHYPDVPLHGDFTTIKENEYEPIDLLVGGTPCQSFSVAGLRGGLDDDRGNLALEFCLLAKRLRPRWVVWENVPGVLSSNGGRDFGSILGALEELGYGLAYRVLDAQYFGVAQRRRRVFVVGYLGDWRRAAAVLFERDSMSGHPAPSREARKEAARAASGGAGERGVRGRERSDIAGPLTAGMGKGPRGTEAVESNHAVALTVSNGEPRLSDVMGTLDCWSVTGRGSSQQLAVLQQSNTVTPFDTTQITSPYNYSNPKPGDVCHPLAAGAHAPAVAYAIQAGALRTNPASGPDGLGVQADHAYTLEARSEVQAVAYSIMPMNSGKDYKARETEVAQPIMAAGPVGGNQGGDFIVGPSPIAFALRGREEGAVPEIHEDGATAGTLRAANGGSSRDYIAFAQNTRDEVRIIGGDGQIAGALAAQPGMKQTTYIAFSAKDYGGDATEEMSPTLRAGGHSGSHANAGVMPAVTYPINTQLALRGPDTSNTSREGVGVGGESDPAFTLQAGHSHAVALFQDSEFGIAEYDTAGSLRAGRIPAHQMITQPSAVAYAIQAGALRTNPASGPDGVGVQAVAFQSSQSGVRVGDVHATLDSNNGPRRHNGVLLSSAVRRLTPVECERLQGFPDNFTAIPWRKKGAEDCPDGPRYKALGNSMAVPVMRWIGERIAMVDAIPTKGDLA